jgi:hypothetical protein
MIKKKTTMTIPPLKTVEVISNENQCKLHKQLAEFVQGISEIQDSAVVKKQTTTTAPLHLLHISF